MNAEATKRGVRWGALRSIPCWWLITGCSVFQIATLLFMVFLFVLKPLAKLEMTSERIAAQALTAQMAHKQANQIRSLRTEEQRYGVSANSKSFAVGDLGETAHMNLLFEHVSGLAREVGVSIRSFERAGQGLNLERFALVALDTNFLQMRSFITALSKLSTPLEIADFSARRVSGSPDKISFSLTISLPRLERDPELICAP